MTTPFRHAEVSDIPFIVDLLREFYRKQGKIYGIPFDAPSCIYTVTEILSRGICLVGPSSVAAAMIVPGQFNHSVRFAHVPFWYFRSPREIRILDALIEVCRKAGATHLNVASHYPENRIGRYYEKKGLHPVESLFLLKL